MPLEINVLARKEHNFVVRLTPLLDQTLTSIIFVPTKCKIQILRGKIDQQDSIRTNNPDSTPPKNNL
jgi:hypothetical protein